MNTGKSDSTEKVIDYQNEKYVPPLGPVTDFAEEFLVDAFSRPDYNYAKLYEGLSAHTKESIHSLSIKGRRISPDVGKLINALIKNGVLDERHKEYIARRDSVDPQVPKTLQDFLKFLGDAKADDISQDDFENYTPQSRDDIITAFCEKLMGDKAEALQDQISILTFHNDMGAFFDFEVLTPEQYRAKRQHIKSEIREVLSGKRDNLLQALTHESDLQQQFLSTIADIKKMTDAASLVANKLEMPDLTAEMSKKVLEAIDDKTREILGDFVPEREIHNAEPDVIVA